jgi:hypothetical protein
MQAPASDTLYPFLAEGGEIASLINQFDWAKTPIGPLSNWPANLKSVVAIVLRAKVPMILLWGADGVMIYNEDYAAFAGQRHPVSLGSNVREHCRKWRNSTPMCSRPCWVAGRWPIAINIWSSSATVRRKTSG